jgi:hypothetical protein
MKILIWWLACGGLYAQAPGALPDVSKTLQAISAHAQRLPPILEQIKPQDWVKQGAPETYVVQLKTSQEQCKALIAEAQALSQKPDRLTEVLRVLFRVQYLEVAMSSLEDGLKRYQNPAMAELLSGTRAENTPNREKLQQYAVELADQREQDLRVADAEAQRCRGNLSQQAPKKK